MPKVKEKGKGIRKKGNQINSFCVHVCICVCVFLFSFSLFCRFSFPIFSYFPFSFIFGLGRWMNSGGGISDKI